MVAMVALTPVVAFVAMLAFSEALEVYPPVVVALPDGSGSLSGVSTGSSVKFLGIPYANQVRWTSPTPVTPWKGVRNATEYGPNCLQYGTSVGPAWSTMRGPYSEDCLFLNVFSPTLANKAEALPVMVFIHGGGYAYGGSHDTELDGHGLMELYHSNSVDQPTVVVTINYRLDVFGFLGSDLLRSRGKDHSTGNWGMQDQRAALEWCQRNIRAFNGDPTRVTIFGESAGAGSVSNHVVMDRSWGLFKGAIMQSGAFQKWVSKSMENAEQNFKALVSELDCPSADPLPCLLGKTGTELLAKSEGTRLPHTDSLDACQWAPTEDGVELSAPVKELLRLNHTAPGAKMMLGSNRDEGTSFIGYSLTGALSPALPYNLTQAGFLSWLNKMWGPQAVAVMPSIYKVNASSPDPKNFVYKDYWVAATKAVGDYMMTCPSRYFSRQLAANGVPTDLYFFSEMPGAEADRWGVFHGAEIRFVFNDLDELEYGPDAGEDERTLARIMACYWSSFAYGHVEGTSTCGVPWPEFKAANNYTTIHFELPEATLEQELHDRACNAWDEIEYGVLGSSNQSVIMI